jgi:cell volume regulation protein A
VELTYFHFLLFGSIIVIIIKLVSSYFSRYGIPTLLFSLSIGLVLGNGDNFLNFDYNNPLLTLRISEIALCIIIFYGGFNTHLSNLRGLIRPGLTLSSIGVVITTGLNAIFFHVVLDFTLSYAFLLGAIISSTDAAAVFSIFEQKKMQFRDNIDQILKIESGSNDPMTYILVILFSTLITTTELKVSSVVTIFLGNILIGIITGIVGSKFIIFFIEKTKIEIGQIPIALFAVIILLYSVNSLFGGNIYLAVYISGLLFDQEKWDNKSTNAIFFESLSWLLEIILFFLLGLQVYLQQLYSNLFSGILVTLILICISRPLAVFISLGFEKSITTNQKKFLSWTGLKGAAPIVFALIPLVYDIPDANILFDITFLVVLISLIIHSVTVKQVAIYTGVVKTDIDSKV